MQTLCLWKEKIKFPHIKKPMNKKALTFTGPGDIIAGSV